MLQTSNLRLFSSHLKNPSALSFPLFCKRRTPSSSSGRHRNLLPRPLYLARRANSSLTEGSTMSDAEKGLATEEVESVGFNRKRAEGRDKSDKPKNLQLKVRKLNPTNTICYAQILGTGMDTQDTSPSVLLFFDKQRFIFNAGEGLQRFCTEHKIKLSKIDHIFLSRVCSETAGGLPGLLLTLAGIGETGMTVNIWGPSDFNYLVNAMRSFIPKAAMVHTHSFGSPMDPNGILVSDQRGIKGPVVLVNDEVVKISAILLMPAPLERSQDSPEMGIKERKQLSELISPRSPRQTAELVKPGEISVIYVCELPEIQGKFDPAKAVALGLRPGPKYHQLQLGKSVKSDYQNIMVNPSDVMDPPIPGPIVLLVDCPSASHMQELLSVKSLSSYYTESSGKVAEVSKTVNCVIHLSPMSVTSTVAYKNWMKRFGGAQHIMAGHEMKNAEIPILKSSVRIATRLNYLCPQFFPTPGLWSLQHPNSLKPDCAVANEGTIAEPCESISAQNLLKFHLRPYSQLGLDISAIPTSMASSMIIDELKSEIPEIVDAANQVDQLWHAFKEAKEEIIPQQDEVMIEEPWLNTAAAPSCLENITREDVEIVLLGTGSSQPSKYRNVSSIYINLFSNGSLLFDCGEGTLAQLKRRFGVEGADDAVRALRFIWISHIHADHHAGLARILALRCDLMKGLHHEPLLVIGPGSLKKYLDAYQRLENLDMQFLNCQYTTEASLGHSSPASPDISENGAIIQNTDTSTFTKVTYWKKPGSPTNDDAILSMQKNFKKVLCDAGLEALISFPVVHCPQAFGVVLKASDRINSAGKAIPGWKIVYSGDTRPCPELIEASRGATVLIHEATFEEGLEDEAIQRNHSTTKEAVEVGASAGAYRIILTHFSQRYPKIPVFDERHMHKTCIAFDLMSINLADLPVLPKVLPYLKLLFKNEVEVEADESDDVTCTTSAVAG